MNIISKLVAAREGKTFNEKLLHLCMPKYPDEWYLYYDSDDTEWYVGMYVLTY